MIPLGGMHHLALEALEPFDVGHVRYVQRTGGQHKVAAIDGHARGGAYRPTPGGLIEMGFVHFLVELDKRPQLVLLHGIENVVLDFIPGRIALAPVRLAGERKGIQVRLHIAGRPRIAVEVPGAAHFRCFFQDHKILVARFPQFNRHAKPAETGAHNGHIHGNRLC